MRRGAAAMSRRASRWGQQVVEAVYSEAGPDAPPGLMSGPVNGVEPTADLGLDIGHRALRGSAAASRLRTLRRSRQSGTSPSAATSTRRVPARRPLRPATAQAFAPALASASRPWPGTPTRPVLETEVLALELPGSTTISGHVSPSPTPSASWRTGSSGAGRRGAVHEPATSAVVCRGVVCNKGVAPLLGGIGAAAASRQAHVLAPGSLLCGPGCRGTAPRSATSSTRRRPVLRREAGSCRPSFAVAFEHRLAHRAQREARVALAAM